jgi:hypothetical protein
MKIKRFLAMFIVIATLVGIGSALAANNQPYTFTFTNTTATQNTSSYKKADDDQDWYISIYLSGSNMSDTNTFGAKTHKSSGSSTSTWHTFSNYVSGYALDYTVTVSSNDYIYMECRKNSSSTSTANLNVNGQWCP